MIATAALEAAAAALLAADTGSLAEATTFCALHLAKAPFTPSRALLIGGLTEADFDGYAAIHAASAVNTSAADPATGEPVIQLREPAGGWHWQTSGNTHLPETIYGYYLTNAAGTVLWGAELFRDGDGNPVPITLSGNPQGIDVGQVRFRQRLNYLY